MELFGKDARFLTLEQWNREFELYQDIRQKRFFAQFRLAKAFRSWRQVVRRQKFNFASRELEAKSVVFGCKPMKICFVKVRSLLAQLETMGVVTVSMKSTKHINDFHAQQIDQIAKFKANFADFRAMLLKLVLEACSSTFSDAGFNQEDYGNEFIMYKLSKSRGTDRKSSTLSGLSPGQDRHRPTTKKLSFIEQANKRQCCLKILGFINLIDFMMRFALHKVVYNSIVAIQSAITERSKMSLDDGDDPGLASLLGGLESRPSGAVMSMTNLEEVEQIIPVFSLTVGVTSRQISFTPDMSVFENSFRDIIGQLNEVVNSFSPLITDRVFHPFTQPVLYGKLENYKPSQSDIFFSGHIDKCTKLLDSVQSMCDKAFQLCRAAMTPFAETAADFFKPDTAEADEDEIETDVEVLKKTMASLQRQQNAVKSVRDSRAIAFFKVDLRLFKRTVLPNISKAIIKLQESLPRVGREKMEEFNLLSRKLGECIDFEPKTAEEFVKNMDLVQKMNHDFDILEKRLMSIENVYEIMNEIPIPISADDKNALKSLKTTINALAQRIQDRINGQRDVLPRFQKQLEIEERILRETAKEALKEVSNPALLESEASIEEIKPTLKKIEKVLEQAREKVSRFNCYEENYGFQTTDYPDLRASEATLEALESLWNGVERWDRLYDTWSTLNFDLLDVNDCRAKTECIKLTLESAQAHLGENPIAKELRDKVSLMLSNLPTLEFLKAKFLKERHWKRISDIIGSDIKPHKITLGFLEQNNVFSFADQVVRVIKAAEMEEQLDELIEGLKLSWTGQKLKMTPRHGVPTIMDFAQVNDIIVKSLTTLKQLGSSQFSTDMRPQLLDWYKVVDEAQDILQVLQKVQEMWLEQDSLLTSMTTEDEMPDDYANFKRIRNEVEKLFHGLNQSESLLAAFQNPDLMSQCLGILSSLEETKTAAKQSLMSLRCGSPWLFFLNDGDLRSLMSSSKNDIRAIEPYLFKIFPWFSNLILVPETETVMTKQVNKTRSLSS